MSPTTPPAHLIAKRDATDERDIHFEPSLASLPQQSSLRASCPPVYNQLTIKSCSANAIAAAVTMFAAARDRAVEPPSRLFVYYNARLREGEAAQDDGAAIRDALKAAADPGMCPESAWPYDPANVCTAPPQDAYAAVTAHVRRYVRIRRDLDALKSCIAEGCPFLFGVQMHMSTIESAQTTGRLILPVPNDAVMGGHALLAVGYDDSTQTLTALNSCGPQFGDNGYLLLPYSYLTDEALTYDFWTIRDVAW